MIRKTRISVLCSGNGTNLQALIDACREGRIPGQIVKVTVNKRTAYATERAAGAGIPTDYFNLVASGFLPSGEKDEDKRRAARLRYDEALAGRVLADRPELVVLAGWMHVFSEAFLAPLAAARVPIINLHPALPGAYDGAGAIARAFGDFQAGRLANDTTGIMVHFVIAEVDRGEPILQQEIRIERGESLAGLEERIHHAEHKLLVDATALIAKRIADERPLT